MGSEKSSRKALDFYLALLDSKQEDAGDGSSRIRDAKKTSRRQPGPNSLAASFIRVLMYRLKKFRTSAFATKFIQYFDPESKKGPRVLLEKVLPGDDTEEETTDIRREYQVRIFLAQPQLPRNAFEVQLYI